ncbi:MAG TPA: ABC transporter permease [Bryobacteraceae bacterium]|jgi:predicted permease|nr:ABC transporter permease [Bryobacteraceae bacterium]
MRRLVSKLRSFIFRGRAEREMAREMDAHLQLLEDDFSGRGMTPDAARLAARRAYGGVEQGRELHRDERSFVWLEQLFQDLRHACRGLAGSPGFTLLAIVTLALGIGVNAALFCAYNGIALKPLPVADPDHVVRFKRSHNGRGWSMSQFGFSYPEYVYYRTHADPFSSLVAASWIVNAVGSVPGAASTERLSGQLVSANYFPSLGIRPLIGRGFLADEDRTPGANNVAVISYPFWKRLFSGDSQTLGRTIQLNGASFTIIGIAPEEFTGTSADSVVVPDFWAPLSMQAQLVPGRDWLSRLDQQNFQIYARLKQSTVLATGQAEVQLLARQFAAATPQPDGTTLTLEHLTYYPFTDSADFRVGWAATMLIPGLVLFVACVNVGNMLLARGAARQREIGTRLALGAGRVRIIRQLLAESVLLSLLAGGVALLVAAFATKLFTIWSERMVQQFSGGAMNLGLNLAPDIHVAVYVLAISLIAGTLFGLSPALQFTRRDLTMALKDEGISLGNLGGSRLRSLLVAAQVAVSMLLLASAGLLGRGVLRSQSADTGIETRSVFAVKAYFGKRDSAQAIDRQRLLAERLRERPEAAAVAFGGHPFNGGEWYPPIVVGHSNERSMAQFASDTYLGTLGIPLLRGRNFTGPEVAAAAPVAMISESTARRFWPNEDPLGKHFQLDMDPRFRKQLIDFEVIGIVKDVRFDNPTRIDPTHIYLPTSTPGGARINGSHGHGLMDILVRVRGDRQRGVAAIASTVAAFDKDLVPSLELINLEDDEVRPQKAIPQLFAALASILGGLAVTLAGIGIYGVIACLVSHRTREIGIRMALGATPRTVLQAVILQSLRPVFGGMALGLAVAAGLSSLVHLMLVLPGSWDLLYGVPFYDPVTFVGLFCFVLGVAALASAVPARRALGVDPMTALRYE